MIDIDEYIEEWNDHLLGSEGVQDLMNALIAEVKQLRKQLVVYMDFLNWVAEEHNDVWDEYEGKDEL